MSHLESRDVGSSDDRIGDRPPAVSASTVARRQICLNQPVTGSAIFLKAPGGISQVNENANIFEELDGPVNQLHHRRAGPSLPVNTYAVFCPGDRNVIKQPTTEIIQPTGRLPGSAEHVE